MFSYFLGAFYGYYLGRCQFNFPDSSDVVLVEQLYFNKILLGQYNSTLGKVVPFTKKAEDYADVLNKLPRFQAHQIWKTNRCKTGAKLANENLPATGNFHKMVKRKLYRYLEKYAIYC